MSDSPEVNHHANHKKREPNRRLSFLLSDTNKKRNGRNCNRKCRWMSISRNSPASRERPSLLGMSIGIGKEELDSLQRTHVFSVVNQNKTFPLRYYLNVGLTTEESLRKYCSVCLACQKRNYMNRVNPSPCNNLHNISVSLGFRGFHVLL